MSGFWFWFVVWGVAVFWVWVFLAQHHKNTDGDDDV